MKDGWTVEPNQSSDNNSTTNYPGVAEGSPFRYSDLQVAKVTLTTTGGVTTGSSTMEHRMGLVGIILSAHNVYDNLFYDGNTYNSTTKTWTVSSYGTYNTWNGSTAFSSTDKPLVSGTTCYHVVKPASTTLSYSTSTDEANKKYAWTQDCTAVATAGKYESYIVDYDVDFIAATWLFSHPNSKTGKEWVAPKTGTYRMECWGASGGGSMTEGVLNRPNNSAGKGGYTRGDLSINSLTTSFYIYVGGKGGDATLSGSRAYGGSAGWNGGGSGANDSSDDEADGGGGGATDIRLNYNSTPTDFTSLKSRIMVAGGGGGAGYGGDSYPAMIGGCGGNITAGVGTSGGTAYGTAATQVSGNAFGRGGNGVSSANASQPGGGGGYYGGNVKSTKTDYISCAGGGSSFISGYSGCNAIKEGALTGGSSNHTGSSNHYSGFVFIENTMSMISGATSGMPNPNETSLTTNTITGNSGNGYCRITYIPD